MISKNKKVLNILDRIILILNVVFTVVLLFSYLTPIADPRNFSIIAILGFGYQVLLFINILLIVYWIIRYKIYFLISLFGILVGFEILTSNFSFHLPNIKNKEKAEEGNIRIMAYNVHEFESIDKYHRQPIQNQIFQIINEKHPDIIEFEEFRSKKSDSGAITKSLKNILGYRYHYYKPFHANVWDSLGNAIFTKFPIVDSGSISSPEFLNIKAIYVDLRYGGKTIRVYCIHLAAVQINENDKRKYLSGRINFKKSSFIEGQLNSAFQLRSLQVAIIKKHMSQCPYPYIVAGDFNDTPISFAVNKLSEGLKNAFIEKGSGFGTTYYSGFPKLHIDYILVSPQFDVINYQTIDKKLSDHKPIMSDLKLR